MLQPTTGETPGMEQAGLTSINGAMPAATSTANAGATAATNYANGDYTTNRRNQYLTPTASGAYVNSSNPEFQNVVGQMSNALQPEIDGSMAADGRYGSGADANAFASALTNETGQLAYGNYTQEQANQLAAANQLSTNNATGAQQQLTGASLTPGVTTDLFTPGTTSMEASYAPLMAYIQSITAGNGGGTVTGSGSGNSATNDQVLNWAGTNNSNGFNL